MSEEILSMAQARKKLSRELLIPINKVPKRKVLTSGRFKILQKADSSKGLKWKLVLKPKPWYIQVFFYWQLYFFK